MKPIRTGRTVAIAAGAGVTAVILLGVCFWKDIAAKYYAMNLQSDDPTLHIRAIESLESLGPRGLPGLFQALNERPDLWQVTGRSIGRVRPLEMSTVKKLVVLLNDGRQAIRAGAALALATIGPEAREALPELIEALSDPDPDVRSVATSAMAYLDLETFSSLPVLLKQLKDESPLVRAKGAVVLEVFAQHGKDIGPAIPNLIENLADPDGYIQNLSWIAIQAAGQSAKSEIPALQTMVMGRNKSAAALALSILGTIALNENFGLFMDALKDSDPGVCGVAIECLLAVPGKPTLDALLEAFKSGSAQFRINMLGWLRSSGSPHAIPIFVEALKDSDPENRIMAADSLGNRGPAAKEAIRALKAAAADPDADVKNSAETALKEIDEGTSK